MWIKPYCEYQYYKKMYRRVKPRDYRDYTSQIP